MSHLALSYESPASREAGADRDALRAAQIADGDLEEDSKPRHECGVFGVFSQQKNASRVAFFALYALNHREWIMGWAVRAGDATEVDAPGSHRGARTPQPCAPAALGPTPTTPCCRVRPGGVCTRTGGALPSRRPRPTATPRTGGARHQAATTPVLRARVYIAKTTAQLTTARRTRLVTPAPAHPCPCVRRRPGERRHRQLRRDGHVRPQGHGPREPGVYGERH